MDFNQLVPRPWQGTEPSWLCHGRVKTLSTVYRAPRPPVGSGRFGGDPGIFDLKPHLTLRPYATGKAAVGGRRCF